MCAAPSNFNSNLGMIPPTVPPQQNIPGQALQQFGAFPMPPYPIYPGMPYPSIPPGYPAIPIPIPLQQFPPNNNNNNDDDKNSSDDRRSKRSRDSKSRSHDHGSHRKSRDQDDYRDRKRGRDRERDRFNDTNPNKRPIHTVFFCNIPYESNYDEFREFASKFGEITNIYPIFEKGIAFVTYNDIRDAQKAVFSTDAFLHDRKVKRAFAYKPPDHARKNPCDTCSTVLVTSLEDVSKIKADDVIGKMREFGEIRSTSQDRPRNGEFVIKFFKLSDAKNCVDHNGLDLRHETLKIEYLPEEDAGEDPDDIKGKRSDSKRRYYSDDSDNSDSDDNSNTSNSKNSSNSKQPQQQQQQQLQQQQILQMQMQLQQYQQMQLQQLQQIQQLQGQYASQPIPPPPPLQPPGPAAQTATTTTATQQPQPTAFPPYGF